MIYLARFCCICLNNRQKLEKLSGIHEDNLSYHDKLSVLFPHMVVNEVKEVVYICEECKTRIDDMYDFRKMCMSNNVILQIYISKLRLCNNSQFMDSIILNKLTDKEIYNYNIHNSEHADFNINDSTRTNVNKKNDKNFHSQINIHIKKESCGDDIDEYDTQLDKFQYDEVNIKTENSTENVYENNALSSNPDIETNLIKTNHESVHSEIDIYIKQESCEMNSDEYETQFMNTFKSDHTNIKIENCSENDESTNNIDTGTNENIEIIKESITSEYTELDIEFKAINIVEDEIHIEDNIPENNICKNNDSETFIKDVDPLSDNFQTSEDNTSESIIHSENNGCLSHGTYYIENNKPDEISGSSEDNQSTYEMFEANNVPTSENTFNCEFCSKSFSQKQNLDQHKRIHTKPFQCKICNKSFAHKTNRDQHEYIHSDEKPFKCDICNKSFTKKQGLEQHINIHTGYKPFKCDICDKSFCQKSNLNDHIITHTGEKPFKCDICNKSFTQKSTLNTHKNIHLDVHLNQQNSIDTDDKPFKCKICDKSFSHKLSLDHHEYVHSGGKPFKCEICNKYFSKKRRLRQHNYIHTRPYKCEVCNESFSRKESLTTHITKHTGVKPFPCEICNKSFTKKQSLDQHMNLHAGIKPYTCEICNKSFTQKSTLNNHIVTHTKPFQCEICNESFSRKISLDVHSSIHTGVKPFTCDICHNTFTQKRNLDQHMNLHAGIKPYTCEICKKSFTQKSTLNNHIITHSKGKLFKCEICNKTFTRKSFLNIHKNMHTS